MKNLKQLGLVSAAALLSVSAMTAAAQQAPTTPPAEKPPVTSPDVAPAPAPTPAQKPMAPKSTEAIDTTKLIGLSAFSSDGSKVGDVCAVKTAPDGKATLHLRTGGFLGFGGRIVAIPASSYTKSGQNIQLSMTADEVSKLPEVKDEG